jgi:hypothetical protein
MARHHGEFARRRRGKNQTVAKKSRTLRMQAAAAFGNGIIDPQDSAGEARFHALLQPYLQDLRFFLVAPSRQLDAGPDLEKRDGAEEARLRLLCGLPRSHTRIASRGFAQLDTTNIGIEPQRSSILQGCRKRLLRQVRTLQVDGTCFLIAEQLEQSLLGQSGRRSKTQTLADQLGNPPGQRKIGIHRAMPRLAAQGVVAFDGHIHDCTIVRMSELIETS